MKSKLLLVLLTVCVKSFAQTEALPSSSAMADNRFSGASVSENTGRITASVPLYDYRAGGLNVPVTLTYIGNGVKVIQPSNWVGHNWLLNAGGVVTRLVNDYPDELATQRILASTIEAAIADPEELVPLHTFQTKSPTDTRDLRPDLFSFSFPGYSGSFYLDDSMTPHLLDNNAELKIFFTSDFNTAETWTIKIITPDGTSYFFGGENASEKSSTTVKIKRKPGGWMNDSELTPINPISPLCTTAFYLYKIQSASHDEIDFEYHSDATRNVVFFERQERRGYDAIPEIISEGCLDLENFDDDESSVFFGSIFGPKKIKRIYSPNSLFELQFNSEIYQLPSDCYIPTLQYDDRILNSINEVRVYADSLDNFTSKTVTLDYLKPLSTNSLRHRFFLEKVSVYQTGQATSPCETYKFIYDNPQDLPSRFSYKIDLLGYYNGEANVSMIPENQNIILDGAFSDLALRTPNFDTAKKGSLTKIYNPTGGYTTFEYEAPQVRATVDKHKWLRVYRNISTETPNNTLEQNFGIGEALIDYSDEPILTVPEDHQMAVNVHANILGGSGHTNTTVTVLVQDVSESTSESEVMTLSNTPLTYDETFYFDLIKDHQYTIKLILSSTTNTSSVEAFAAFSFRGYEYFPAQGIRIKKVVDYADGNVAKTTRYHYKKAEHVGTLEDDSAVVLYDGEVQEATEEYRCSIESVPQSYRVAGLLTNPFSNIFSSSDNQVEYRYVSLSFGGDNFEEGGMEKHFKIEEKEKSTLMYPDYSTSTLSPEAIESLKKDLRKRIEYGAGNLNNDDGLNGTLLGQRLIERKGLNLYVSSETEYEYQTTEDHVQRCVLIAPDQFLADRETIDPMPIGTYTFKSFRFNLTKSVTRVFPEPYPLSSPAQGMYPITSTTKYTYGTLRGLPTSVITKNSNGKNRIQKLYYPVTADINAMTSVATQDIANYELMEDQNIIQNPIQTESYLQEDDNATPVLLGRARTLFTQVTSTPTNMVMPLSSKSAKANGTLIGFGSISQYDANGRPVEITEPNGLVNSVVYGYGGDTVIAEMSNMSYNSISPTLIASLQSASRNITDATSLASFESQLNTLRTDSAYSAAMVTTYVYDKDGRLSSVTNPRGYKMSKVYDECGRLIFTLDNDGNVLEQTEYNNKTNQN